MKTAVLSCLLAAGLMVAASANAATMVIDPVTAGVGVTVTGSGASPNGPVELYQNGASLGHVFADGTGAFSFPGLTVAGGDTFHATASMVWNFNTDANFEGWAAASGAATSVVAGGVWTVTHDGTGNITLNLVGGNVIPDTNVSRVFEMRHRTTMAGAITTSVVIYDPGSGFQFGPQNALASSPTNFTTVHLDMTNGGGNNYTSTGVSTQLAPGCNGWTLGDTWEIDYIRMHEYFAWEFNYANDSNSWAPTNGTMTVAGGAATLTNAAAGTAVQINQPFYQTDASYFNTFDTSVDGAPTINPNLQDFQYFTQGFAFTFGGHRVNWAAIPGTYVNNTFDLTGAPLFGPGWLPIAAMNFPAGGFQPFFPNTAGEVAKVDYLRLRPAAAFGPAPTVTATGGATENDGINIY